MLIGREQIEPLLPHSGVMLLIDEVTGFDDHGVVCLSRRHRDHANPLRRAGRLSSLHAVEFAAQAAAIHGGLMSQGGTAPLRALAAIRRACFHRARLDDLEGDLTVEARVVLLDAHAAIYQARLAHDDEAVADMRLTLMTLQPVSSP
jgi:predicted hotdog family 3-hydroxylacyl-ACP dehydratase